MQSTKRKPAICRGAAVHVYTLLRCLPGSSGVTNMILLCWLLTLTTRSFCQPCLDRNVQLSQTNEMQGVMQWCHRKVILPGRGTHAELCYEKLREASHHPVCLWHIQSRILCRQYRQSLPACQCETAHTHVIGAHKIVS